MKGLLAEFNRRKLEHELMSFATLPLVIRYAIEWRPRAPAAS